MKSQTKTFQQKLRKMHPNLEPQVKAELNKLLVARIIFPVRCKQWISNLVPVRKNNGDIRLCVNFRNVNRSSEKYNYPVPPMEKILQCVSGSKTLSLLDGFLGYNKFLVAYEDQLKTTFKTKWGTYAYRNMPFGLINVGATFQRPVDISFRGLVVLEITLKDQRVMSRHQEFRECFKRWFFLC
jgi:hypothetical protein